MSFSFINLEYPIFFNEPQTLLMKIMHCYVVSLELIIKASNASNPLEQMKWIITFIISLMKYSLFSQFPLNSICGKTLKITLSNDIIIIGEAIRISPRQITINIITPGFELKALHEIDYILDKTDIKIKFFKSLEISFKKIRGSKIVANQFPILSIYDLFNIKRTLHFDGSLLLSNKNENLHAVLNFGSSHNDIIIDELNESPKIKEECWFTGHISQDFNVEEKLRDNEMLCFVDGIWIKMVRFDDEVFWKFGEKNVGEENVLVEGDEMMRGDWIEARLGEWEEAKRKMEKLKGKEKVGRWIELMKFSVY